MADVTEARVPPTRSAADEDAGAGQALADSERSELEAMHREMLRIRVFEERVADLYRDSEIPGFVHVSVGQEAVAVGSCWALDRTDYITSTHRGHGHCLAKGADMVGMFAELLGRETGTCQGRGGSMHIADPRLGILGANGIVAAGLPIAVGASLRSKLIGSGSVVLAFFGDGGVAQGAFHESLNLAALWHLPVIFLCENNHFAEFTPAAAQHPVPIMSRPAAYGIEATSVDGTDVFGVASTVAAYVDRCRAGEGPFFVEAVTYRFRGHFEGDAQRYRDEDEMAFWRARDPITVARERLAAHGVASADLDELEATVKHEVESAIAEARSAAPPAPNSALDFVTAPRVAPPEPDPEPPAGGETFRTMDAICAALAHELEHDPDVVLIGVDVAKHGGAFGVTRGLYERWQDRVLDTPISESAIVGSGVGVAMTGGRPVVEVMFFDFVGVCLDQIMNQAAKLHFMTGGLAAMPLTIRTQFGGGRSSASQHSQSLEAMMAHIPGLTVVMPSTPADAYGLLRSAIRDPNPVIFVEHRGMYGKKGPRPSADHLVPIGRARVVRSGRDLTIVAVSRMVDEALLAAQRMAADGIEAEVIDLRSVVPLDLPSILESVAKTSRLLVAHEAVRDFGIGAEVAAAVGQQGFWHLDAPIARVGAEYSPAPYAPSLEQVWLPDSHKVELAARSLVGA